MSAEKGARSMKSSKKNQRTMAADEKSSMKSSENEPGEETLEMVQGGALVGGSLTRDAAAQVTGIAENVSRHHGVNVSATALDYGLGAAIDFAAYSGGDAITKPKKN